MIQDSLTHSDTISFAQAKHLLDTEPDCLLFDVREEEEFITGHPVEAELFTLDTIDAQTAEHLIFTCGALMTGLVPEIEKIGAYAKGRAVTVEDINAVADPVLDAVVFDMTSAVTKGNYDRASELLGQLLKKQEEPIMILGVISKELRRLYTARLALDSGKDKLWLMDLWNMRSDYPARLLLDAARKTTHEWCANSLALCQKLDRRMKSEKGIDREGELKLLLMQLAQRA